MESFFPFRFASFLFILNKVYDYIEGTRAPSIARKLCKYIIELMRLTALDFKPDICIRAPPWYTLYGYTPIRSIGIRQDGIHLHRVSFLSLRSYTIFSLLPCLPGKWERLRKSEKSRVENVMVIWRLDTKIKCVTIKA